MGKCPNDWAAEISALAAEHFRTAGKEPRRVQARSIALYWAVRELGMTTVAVSKMWGICQTAVTKAVSRGQLFAKKREIGLENQVINSAPSPLYVPLI